MERPRRSCRASMAPFSKRLAEPVLGLRPAFVGRASRRHCRPRPSSNRRRPRGPRGLVGGRARRIGTVVKERVLNNVRGRWPRRRPRRPAQFLGVALRVESRDACICRTHQSLRARADHRAWPAGAATNASALLCPRPRRPRAAGSGARPPPDLLYSQRRPRPRATPHRVSSPPSPITSPGRPYLRLH